MVSLRFITAIVLSFFMAAIGSAGFAAEKSHRNASALAPISAAPKITVTAPMAGADWKAGSSQTVAWSYTANTAPSVSIVMFKGTAKVYTLTASAPLDGSGKGTFTWTVPKDAVAGSDYGISVVSNTNPAVKGTSGLFSLIPGAERLAMSGAAGPKTFAPSDVKLTALITVTQPKGGDEWTPGSSRTIAWEKKSGDKTGNVKIDLLKGNAAYKSVTASVPLGSGKFVWPVPADLPVGEYRIQIVKTTDSGVQGTTDFFDVVKPGIEILTPHAGDKWPSGETHELKWRVTGIPADPKTMVQVRKTSWDWPDIYDSVTQVPMTESHLLKLTTPPGQAGADYLITVSIVDPATNKKYESTLQWITIGSPFIQIENLVELTAAPWTPGKTYQVKWKTHGIGATGDVTYAITDLSGANIYLSSTATVGNAGTYEWTAKAFAKKMKFSVTPAKKNVAGASFVFEIDTGKYPILSPALTAPSAPTLTAGLIDYKQHVALKWQDKAGNEKEFVVERKAAGGSAYGEIGRVPMNGTAYEDKAIPKAGVYRYRVRAVNDNGSASSNEVEITTLKAAAPVDLVPVNPHPEKGLAGYCPVGGYTGNIDITIRNLGPGPSSSSNAFLFVKNKQYSGFYEELKTAVPGLQKGESFVWHATAPKCLEGKGPDCEFNLMINYNPKEVLESDMSTNDIYFTCRGLPKLQNNLAPAK